MSEVSRSRRPRASDSSVSYVPRSLRIPCNSDPKGLRTTTRLARVRWTFFLGVVFGRPRRSFPRRGTRTSTSLLAWVEAEVGSRAHREQGAIQGDLRGACRAPCVYVLGSFSVLASDFVS